MAFRRQKMSRKGSRKLFSKTAGSRRVHPKNIRPVGVDPMRGGIRL